jgi:hypothetical protein
MTLDASVEAVLLEIGPVLEVSSPGWDSAD